MGEKSMVHSAASGSIPGEVAETSAAKALTPSLMGALAECLRHNERGLLYWFRSASMIKLAGHGLVEQWTPPSVSERPRMSRRPWRVTSAGRQILKDTNHDR